MTREEKAIHGLLYADGSYESFAADIDTVIMGRRTYEQITTMRAFLSIICPENGNIIRMHFLRRRMIWINIIFVIFLLGNMVEWNLETVGEVRMEVVHTG